MHNIDQVIRSISGHYDRRCYEALHLAIQLTLEALPARPLMKELALEAARQCPAYDGAGRTAGIGTGGGGYLGLRLPGTAGADLRPSAARTAHREEPHLHAGGILREWDRPHLCPDGQQLKRLLQVLR